MMHRLLGRIMTTVCYTTMVWYRFDCISWGIPGARRIVWDNDDILLRESFAMHELECIPNPVT